MITTTHAIVNSTLLGDKEHPERYWPIVLGSIFPDLATFLFLCTPIYFALGGKANLDYSFFWTATDWLHSIPLASLGLLLCLPLRYQKGLYFFMGMILHDLEDLPVHAHVVHREFLPLSQYVYHSPISYWEPNHHANIVAPLEWVVVFLCVLILWRRGISAWLQIGLLFVVIFQAVLLLYSLGFHWGVG